MTKAISVQQFRELVGTSGTSKGRAKKCRCALGHIHGSRQESQDCANFQIRKKVGFIKDFRVQVSLPVGGGLYWKIDFEITELDGTLSHHETKGFNRSDDNALLKLRMSQKNYPERVIYWNGRLVPPLDKAGRLQLRYFHKRISQKKEWAKKIAKIQKKRLTDFKKSR